MSIAVRTSRNGRPWAWLDLKDETSASSVRVKAWGDQAKILSEAQFLSTYDFNGFNTQKSEYGLGVEMAWGKGASMDKSDTPLDEADEWDTLEYAPLSDIGSTTIETRRNFIVKMVDEGETVDDMVAVKFKDEENEERTIQLHMSYKDILKAERVFVIHRAKLSGAGASVDTCGMFTPAPTSYLWT